MEKETWYEVHTFTGLFIGKVKSVGEDKITFHSLYNVMVIPDQTTGATKMIPVRIQPVFTNSKEVTDPFIYLSNCYSYYEMSELDVEKVKELIREVELAQSGFEIAGSGKKNLKLLKN